MKRNDVHDYTDGVQVRIVGSQVTVTKNGQVVARDVFQRVNSGPRTRRVADLYYKKHILGTYDDEGRITTPYNGYCPEYSPVPGVMIRVIEINVGFGCSSKVLVAANGTQSFQKVWVPKGRKVTDVIQEKWGCPQ